MVMSCVSCPHSSQKAIDIVTNLTFRVHVWLAPTVDITAARGIASILLGSAIRSPRRFDVMPSRAATWTLFKTSLSRRREKWQELQKRLKRLQVRGNRRL